MQRFSRSLFMSCSAFKSAGIRMRSIPSPRTSSKFCTPYLKTQVFLSSPPPSGSQDSLGSVPELLVPARDVQPSPSFESNTSTARPRLVHHEWSEAPDCSRAELLRDQISRLDISIVSQKNILQGDLRRRRHLAVLAPILAKTRQNLEFGVIPPLAKRVRAIRLRFVPVHAAT